MPRGISKEPATGSGTVRHQDVRARRKHVPEVPTETMTSPASGPATRAADALSPAPAPKIIEPYCPGLSAGRGLGNPHDAAQRALKQVEPVFIGDGRPVARPTRVAAIGCERLDRQAVVVLRTEESPGEASHAEDRQPPCDGDILEFVLGEHRSFADGE